MTIWMEVTQDEYELPVLIALSAGGAGTESRCPHEQCIVIGVQE